MVTHFDCHVSKIDRFESGHTLADKFDFSSRSREISKKKIRVNMRPPRGGDLAIGSPAGGGTQTSRKAINNRLARLRKLAAKQRERRSSS